MEKLTKKELKALRHEERVESETREKKRKRIKEIGFWVGFAVLLLASIGVIFFLARPKSAGPAEISPQVNQALPQVTSTDYVTGAQNARVTLIEYGDFQCPACAHYFPMVTQLKKEFPDTLRVVFRNFPLPSVHKNAQLAAQAAYAAGKQNKFWEMHDALYEKQTAWAESDTADQLFAQYATEMQLDPVRFTSDMYSQEATTFIASQSAAGQTAGVQGTPTFFLNGKQMTNPLNYEEFKATIEQELR